jgi:hypothetical protein
MSEETLIGPIRWLPNLRFRSTLLGLFLSFIAPANISMASQPDLRRQPEIVERVAFDWDRSGRPTIFTLLRQDKGSQLGEPDLLVIKRSRHRIWTFKAHDSPWTTLRELGLGRLEKQNQISSKRFLFVSGTIGKNGQSYLILKGADSSCCVGSLTVFTAGEGGRPRVVFNIDSYLLKAILPLSDGNGIQVIGQPSDSEAWADKNAQSYNPYRVYVLRGETPAQYDLQSSIRFTLSHYCQWHGPIYDERFVAVGNPTGANHCRVLPAKSFRAYQMKHPEMFSQAP